MGDVETSTVPDWLEKLEKRRELVSKGRLGHESGAGAPCLVCGTQCPGLDLHFWRKVCRNCKCRKDQHDCPVDDDLTGWAQFEILGQTRSNPAYIKVAKIAENPVKLDWVPPNVRPDLVSDYMNQLGQENIPVSGSEAASKRKQRLEFQVPPHDLDATLCHNLTDKETAQLQKYVESIRENCVGQGNVIRLGDKQRAIIGYVGSNEEEDDDLPPPPSPIVDKNPFQTNHCLIEELFNPDGSLQVEKLVPDKLLYTILHSDMVKAIRELPMSATERATVSSTLPEMAPDFIVSPHLKPATMDKLRSMKINTTGIRSAVLNGPIYDRLFKDLRDRNINFEDDSMLGPISKFRDNYRTDEAFRNDADNFVRHLDPNYEDSLEEPTKGNMTLKGIVMPMGTPLRHLMSPSKFHSPVNARLGARPRESSFLTQETPMRKLRFPSSFIQLHDPVYPQIASIIEDPRHQLTPGSEIVIYDKPLVPDFPQRCKLSSATKEKLSALGLNSDAVRSGVINGPQYDQLFRDLRGKRIRFGEDKLLGPMEAFRDEYLADPELRNEANQFTLDTADDLPETLVASKSSDSGFDSVPPTPNYGSYPGRMAQQGAFAQIPGIESLNMYPEVTPSRTTVTAPLVNQMHDLKINSQFGDCDAGRKDVASLNINCKQCLKDIRLGEVVVKAQRAGKEVAWHPQCFVCHTCNDLLADLVYFFHSGNVYCARDLAEILKIPRCKACDELIFTNEYTAAENATFHIKHFCCFQCDTPLAGQKYIPDDKTNMPMCLNCFNEFHAQKCRQCKLVIGPTEQGVSWKDLHWHGACFTCAGRGCGKSLIGSRFCVKNEMTFCSADCVQTLVT